MLNSPTIAIGLGMVIGLILTESVGVTAGGIIVPGYIALNLHNPFIVITTFCISLVTILSLNILSDIIQPRVKGYAMTLRKKKALVKSPVLEGRKRFAGNDART